MALATVIGILMVPVTFSAVEFLSHRFRPGGKGTTMDCGHPPEPLHTGDRDRNLPEGGQA